MTGRDKRNKERNNFCQENKKNPKVVTGADAVVSPASAPETTSMLFLRIKTAATADAAHSLVGRRRRREREKKKERGRGRKIREFN